MGGGRETVKKQGEETQLRDAALLGMVVRVHAHAYTDRTHIFIYVQTCRHTYILTDIHACTNINTCISTCILTLIVILTLQTYKHKCNTIKMSWFNLMVSN